MSGDYDAYDRCSEVCNHDLGRGVLVAELLGTDRPEQTLTNAVVPGDPEPAIVEAA